MKIFNNPSIEKKYRGSALAIGNFDGIHKGHQKVFNETKIFAKKNKIKFGILTFAPLPAMFFNKKISNFRLASEEQKFKLFKRYGVDFVINIRFNRNFSKITASEFLDLELQNYDKILEKYGTKTNYYQERLTW